MTGAAAGPGVPKRSALFSWGARDRLRTLVKYNSWAIPVLFATAGTILGLGLPYLDRSTEISIGLDWDPGAATAALGAIISGSLALVGFVYTVALLVLQLQYQFSPRLIRLLAGNQTPKIAIGALVGNTVYALLVLRAIDGDFVPQLSTMLALVLAALGIFAFLVTIGQLLRATRTSEMISQIGTLTRQVITQLYPERGSPDDPGHAPARPDNPKGRVVDYKAEPGVVVGFDAAGAARLAAANGATVYLEPALGEFVHHGSALFRIDDHDSPVEDAQLRALVLTGNERTFEQDPAYGFRLLVDMAISALSPATNDPTTAVQVLDELDDLLRMLAPRRLRRAIEDKDGRPWLYYRRPSWQDYVGLACNEIRYYGAAQPQVVRRMRAVLEDLRDIVPPDRRPTLDEQLELLETRVTLEFSDPRERAIAEMPDRLGFGGPGASSTQGTEDGCL
jgi:uncharacterized membrane protein